MKTTKKDMGALKIIENALSFGTMTLDVGIFPGEVVSGDLSLAEIALINEFGTDDGMIPARPAMRTSVDTHDKKYNRMIEKSLGHVMDGAKPKGEWEKLGIEARNDFIKTDTAWTSPPNAEATIEAKGANNPLVDTGARRNAYTWKVTKGKS